MATAVHRSHDALNNRMHLDAFTPSPTKPRRRRSPKPAGASSLPPRAAAVASPAPKQAAVASPPVKAAAPSRRSPPARPAAGKQPSPPKEKPKQRLVMEEVRILKRGEEPPAPAPAPARAPVLAAPVAQSAAVDQRVLCAASRIGPQEPAVVPTKILAAADAAGYAGPAFSATAPEPSSLPFPAFIRRAETEATRGLRCLLRIGELA
ncbi:alpha carbonic anhydrase 8-like [Phragmites australis]|uniref:alpha carbonic anhydrase 8-like n=1 Tax=Phragmites australis TaxID=29695 RepID=UPI002D7A3E39|nr:alpha carbonic anhydrase 8-like [Phragmites australis]